MIDVELHLHGVEVVLDAERVERIFLFEREGFLGGDGGLGRAGFDFGSRTVRVANSVGHGAHPLGNDVAVHVFETGLLEFQV